MSLSCFIEHIVTCKHINDILMNEDDLERRQLAFVFYQVCLLFNRQVWADFLREVDFNSYPTCTTDDHKILNLHITSMSDKHCYLVMIFRSGVIIFNNGRHSILNFLTKTKIVCFTCIPSVTILQAESLYARFSMSSSIMLLYTRNLLQQSPTEH